jgi:predicted regulator of Ras-like GTPase activity (Roadblock/LC7/MglB family)
MSLAVEHPPEQQTILSDEGSRINGIIRELVNRTGAELALVVRTEGAVIARAGMMQANDLEDVGILSALIYASAQSVGGLLETRVSYVHQHGEQKDLLILKIDPAAALIVAFGEPLGLGGILYSARRSAKELKEILGGFA